MYLLEKEVILCIMIKNLVAYQKTSAIKLPNWDYYFVQMQMIYMMLKKTMILSLLHISSEQKKISPQIIHENQNQFCHDTIHIIIHSKLTSCTKCLPLSAIYYDQYQQ